MVSYILGLLIWTVLTGKADVRQTEQSSLCDQKYEMHSEIIRAKLGAEGRRKG